MSIATLRELALTACTVKPSVTLNSARRDKSWGLKGADFFSRCAPDVETRPTSWINVWSEVRLASTRCTGDVRPQLLIALAAAGRLTDGVLPQDFFDGLGVDSLSVANSRIGRGVIDQLASSQRLAATSMLTLVSLDLSGCLLVDDEAVGVIFTAAVETLRRFSIRDCRKLTDASLDTVAQSTALCEVDFGGNFNMSIAGCAAYVAEASSKTNIKKKQKQRKSSTSRIVSRPPLLGLGVSGLFADDEFLGTLRGATELRRLGIGFGSFSSAGLGASLAFWPKLMDLRVQWTTTFEDAAVDALTASCPKLRALDALGTSISADALNRLVVARGRRADCDEYEEDGSNLEWVNARYTNGPKPALDTLAAAWNSPKLTFIYK